jgi:hypothetical protein
MIILHRPVLDNSCVVPVGGRSGSDVAGRDVAGSDVTATDVAPVTRLKLASVL